MTGIAATRKPTRLIRIPARPLRDLCERDPLLGYRFSTKVIRLLADRLEGRSLMLFHGVFDEPAFWSRTSRRPSAPRPTKTSPGNL